MDKHSVTPSATLPWESGKLPHQGLVHGLPLSDESRQLCSDLFTKLDKNKNGYLEKNEVKKASIGLHSFVAPAARWDWVEMDANKDGVITLAEWLAFFDAKVEPWQGASLTIPISSKEEGEMLAAITRWCEHEAGLEEEAEAAEKVARALALKAAIHPENLHFFGLDWTQQESEKQC